ncbi:adenylate kinase, partial [Sphingobium sp. AP50]|uniref:adenylate kinase family protein n=1 Tax=Sphingobium sp. AP50 TaxID=1884369 RepID=UPI0008CBDDD6
VLSIGANTGACTSAMSKYQPITARRPSPEQYIVSRLIDEHLGVLEADVGVIFDGYPRTTTQAENLDLVLQAHGRSLAHVIELTVDEEALVERVTGRYTCATCGEGYHDRFKKPRFLDICDNCGGTNFQRRVDDNEETVRMRMAEYRAKTAPILPFYERRGLLRQVDGMEEIGHVTSRIAAILG